MTLLSFAPVPLPSSPSQSIDDDGGCPEAVCLEVFDWGLRALLMALSEEDEGGPGGEAGPQRAAELLEAIFPPDEERVDVTLAVAARVGATHADPRRWPLEEPVQFVAQLLMLAKEGEARRTHGATGWLCLVAQVMW